MTSEQFYSIFNNELGYNVTPTTGCENLSAAISKFIIPALNRMGYTLKPGWNNCMTLSSLYNYLTPYTDRSFSNKTTTSSSLPSISQRRNGNVSSLLSKRATILQRIDSINESIERGNICLSIALEDLNDIRPCINIENHWYGGVKNDTIRESILATHENLAHYIQRCGAALRSTNDNLAHTLELVQILAVFEADLYRTLNREAESKKSLKEKVEEWCNQSNIKDETVKELLAASFEKAYILKDRLYDIKEELTQRIDEISEAIDSDQRYEALTATINDLDQRFKSDTRFNELKDNLIDRIEEISSKLVLLSTELNRINVDLNQAKLNLDDKWHSQEDTIMNMQQTINQLEVRLSERNSDSKKNIVATISVSTIVAFISFLLTYIVLQAI